MAKMQLAFYEGGTKYDYLVKARTWSDITHVALLYTGDGGQQTKFEAMPFKGVREVSWLQFPRPYIMHTYDIQGMTDDQARKAAAWATEQLGRQYDYWGILGYTIWLGRLQHKKRWFCSEYAETAIRYAGIVLTPDYAPCRISPARLMDSHLLIKGSTMTVNEGDN